ncbi:preprotein translocase subunit SecE [uncultured Parolsenella sp.]|uniref:preprotein translocase subunit SecE n=1 Tax=uncultured Parolsenella sp. TaxID=2083008 RepID=UPI0027DC7F3B|nr:preprotein translocase subunit SecE [uncultured Parolsenella sp.]
MANKDRQKRSARKARAAERKELEEKHAASQVNAPKKAAPAQATASAKKAAPKKKHFARIRGWFADVKAEMHRVTWPSKSELKNYSVAVIVMLVVFGVAVWLVDTGVVAALVGYSGLRG